MKYESGEVLGRFHQVLIEEIASTRPEYMDGPFTVAEIYQTLVPYRTHRDRIGVELNGDYEDVLLRLLGGEGGYLILESEVARDEIKEELESSNPNTGLYREFAAVDVRLDPTQIPEGAVLKISETATASSAAEPLALDLESVSEEGGVAPAPDLPKEPVDTSASSGGEACGWCSAPLPERSTVNFCPFCGSSVHTRPCPSCGKEIEAGWRFCASCGTEVKA